MKKTLKNFILTTAYYAGVCGILRKRQKSVLTILLYHGVAPEVKDGIYNYRKKFIPPHQFEKQIQYLKDHYTILKLDDAVTALKNNTPLPPFPLVITFDDGYKNNLEYASPILQKYNVPATIFVVTDFIENKTPLWVDRLEYVVGHGKTFADKTYQEKTKIDDTLRNSFKHIPTQEREECLQQLEKENVVSLATSSDFELYAPCTFEEMAFHNTKGISFGAHTVHHPILTQLPFEEAKAEISDSVAMLKNKNLLSSCIFAYPNGQSSDFNEDIKLAVKDSGCKGAVSTLSGTNTASTDLYALKRYTMDGTDSMLSFIVTLTGTFEWFRKLFKA